MSQECGNGGEGDGPPHSANILKRRYSEGDLRDSNYREKRSSALSTLDEPIHLMTLMGRKILCRVKDAETFRKDYAEFNIEFARYLEQEIVQSHVVILPERLIEYRGQAMTRSFNNHTDKSNIFISIYKLKTILTRNTYIMFIYNADGKLRTTLYDKRSKQLWVFTDQGARDEVDSPCPFYQSLYKTRLRGTDHDILPVVLNDLYASFGQGTGKVQSLAENALAAARSAADDWYRAGDPVHPVHPVDPEPLSKGASYRTMTNYAIVLKAALGFCGLKNNIIYKLCEWAKSQEGYVTPEDDEDDDLELTLRIVEEDLAASPPPLNIPSTVELDDYSELVKAVKAEEWNPIDALAEEWNPTDVFAEAGNPTDVFAEAGNPTDPLAEEWNLEDVFAAEWNLEDAFAEEWNPTDALAEAVPASDTSGECSKPVEVPEEVTPAPQKRRRRTRACSMCI